MFLTDVFGLRLRAIVMAFIVIYKKWVANWRGSTERYSKRDNWADKGEIICFKASISRNFSDIVKENNPENIVKVLPAC